MCGVGSGVHRLTDGRALGGHEGEARGLRCEQAAAGWAMPWGQVEPAGGLRKAVVGGCWHATLLGHVRCEVRFPRIGVLRRNGWPGKGCWTLHLASGRGAEARRNQ